VIVMNLPPDPNEGLRLKSLRELAAAERTLDAALDQITAYAREQFQVPICLVTLIEAERQVIISRQGLEVTETPRDVSFCTHTILKDEVLVVADTTQDERFRSNPFVVGEPFIRFYAGAPLISMGETRLGSLCLLDLKPRAFSLGKRSELTRLAEQVMSILIRRAYGLPVPTLSAELTG
jgi:GAF domain-containing protein